MRPEDGFVQVKDCDIPCQDAWPLSRIVGPAMLAYKHIDRKGDLKLRYPVLLYSDCLVIHYDSSLPQEWIRNLLKEEKERITTEAEAELKILEARLLQMDAVMNESLLPVFEKTAAQYKQLNMLLM